MKSLGDLVKILKGRKASEVFDEHQPGAERYLQINDLRPGATPKYARDDKGVLATEDNILIAWDGANAGTVGFGLRGYAGSTIAILRPDPEEVYAPFLGYFLHSKFKYLQETCTGATIPHISRRALEELQLTLPPLPEQKRIAAILAKADRLRRLRRFARDLSDTYLQSVFLEMFGDPVSNPMGWDRAKVSDLGTVQTGSTPPRNDLENYGDYIEWIKSDNIIPGQMFVSRSLEMLSDKGLERGRSVEAGSILVTCIAGSPTSIGNVALTDRRVSFNQQINAVTPDEDIEPLFLYGLFVVAKPLVQRSTTLAMKRMISKSKFEKLVLIKPPLHLQKRFARVVRKLERLRAQQREAERQAEHLFQTLLHRAFRGEV